MPNLAEGLDEFIRRKTFMTNRYKEMSSTPETYHLNLIYYLLRNKGTGSLQAEIVMMRDVLTYTDTEALAELEEFIIEDYFKTSYKRFDPEKGTPATFVANCIRNKLNQLMSGVKSKKDDAL